MIIVDTNVISEFTRSVVSEQVAAWFKSQDLSELGTTAVTEAELLAGIAMMPAGRKRDERALAINAMLERFGRRIYPFDRQAARQFSQVVLQRRLAGRHTHTADGQIAAIARLHGASVATRDVDDFEHAGVQVINPWTQKS